MEITFLLQLRQGKVPGHDEVILSCHLGMIVGQLIGHEHRHQGTQGCGGGGAVWNIQVREDVVYVRVIRGLVWAV